MASFVSFIQFTDCTRTLSHSQGCILLHRRRRRTRRGATATSTRATSGKRRTLLLTLADGRSRQQLRLMGALSTTRTMPTASPSSEDGMYAWSTSCYDSSIKALFSFPKKLQIFSYCSSHQILRHMYGTLNKD